MVGQLNPGVWVLGFLITMSRRKQDKEEEQEREEDDKIRLFWQSVSQLLHTQRECLRVFCELLGSINLSECLVWGL